MDDVIFAGTAKRPALGRAEVALTIDNSAGLLPIEFSEVTVTRTLFRSGDSEYAINGVPWRLLDVQELLSDTGVGRQQHVIVSQGQIDAVLNARPEERRLIIEESKHEAVEEEYFWPAVRELVEDGDRLADHAIEQEQTAKRELDELRRLDAGDRRFEELLANHITDAREHIAYEEMTVWPALRRVITDERAERLGGKLEQAKKTAPTRPHPHTPPKPGVLKTAGPAVAAADRLRDKISGRGRT